MSFLNSHILVTNSIMTHQSIFSIGDNVQVIDHDEHPSEWARFVITDYRNNFYLLSGIDKSPCEVFWAMSNEICLPTLNSKN